MHLSKCPALMFAVCRLFTQCDDDDFRDDVSVCSDFSTTSRYSTTSRAALLEAKSAHAMKDVSRGITNDAATASFEVFKYQVLLTQLEAARARRTEALTRAIRTRDHVRLAMAEALGVERHGEGHEVYCLALDGLVGRTDQISEFSLSAGGNAAMVYSGPLGLDRERGTTRASISAMPTLPSGIPTLVPMGLHQTPTAAVMCNAVNVQLAQVNEAKKSADAACGELLAQQRKAELADRGLVLLNAYSMGFCYCAPRWSFYGRYRSSVKIFVVCPAYIVMMLYGEVMECHAYHMHAGIEVAVKRRNVLCDSNCSTLISGGIAT